MKISRLENYTVDAEDGLECDLFVFYLDLEPRYNYILNNYKISASKMVMVSGGYAEDVNRLLSINEGMVKVNDGAELASDLKRVFSEFGSKSRIVLDISCMPRSVMAEIFSAMSFNSFFERLDVVVLYSLAKFTAPVVSVFANESIEPVHSALAGWSTPESKSTSLIVGLGYEPDKAEGASEYFEPCDQWVFIPSSPVEEFLVEVESNNERLIKESDRNRIIKYSVDDPELTYGQLELVVSSLKKYSNPVILPFGPKIFFFLCLFQCLNHPELGVWSVTGREGASSADVEASKYVIGFRCVLDA